MPYTSDGYQNHQFPKQSLSFNVYINKKELSEELEDFLNTSYQNVVGDDEEDYT